jgi:hypothetical protein
LQPDPGIAWYDEAPKGPVVKKSPDDLASILSWQLNRDACKTSISPMPISECVVLSNASHDVFEKHDLLGCKENTPTGKTSLVLSIGMRRQNESIPGTQIN